MKILPFITLVSALLILLNSRAVDDLCHAFFFKHENFQSSNLILQDCRLFIMLGSYSRGSHGLHQILPMACLILLFKIYCTLNFPRGFKGKGMRSILINSVNYSTHINKLHACQIGLKFKLHV